MALFGERLSEKDSKLGSMFSSPKEDMLDDIDDDRCVDDTADPVETDLNSDGGFVCVPSSTSLTELALVKRRRPGMELVSNLKVGRLL